MGKRPWKRHAYIERVEWMDDRVEFVTFTCEQGGYGRFKDKAEDEYFHGQEMYRGNSFRSLEEAEAALNAWWERWISQQVKSRTRQ